MTDWPMAVAGALAVLFGGLMLTRRSLYSAALCLLLTAFQIAVMFFLAGAPLLGFLQIMIYAGAVMVLVVVTIMASPRAEGGIWGDLSLPRPLAVSTILAIVFQLAMLTVGTGGQAAFAPAAPALQERVGAFLFGPYALATEAVTLLMFVAGLALVEEKAK